MIGLSLIACISCIAPLTGYEGTIIGVVGQGHGQSSDGTDGQQQLISSGVSELLTKPLQTAAVIRAVTGTRL